MARFLKTILLYALRTFERTIPSLPKTNPVTKYADSIKVLYTNDPSSAERWYEKYVPDELATIGFDVESNPIAPWVKIAFTGPACVQLSVLESTLVLHLVNDDGSCSKNAVPFLQSVLGNQNVVKAGVGIDQDMIELFRHWDPSVTPQQNTITDIRGRFDIGGIGGKNGETLSLKRLANGILGVELPKSRKIAISNWGKIPLSDQQIAYAARDAWIAAAVMHEMARLDEATFSTEAISNLVLPNEVPIVELDKRATARKVVKLQYLEIMGRGDTRVSKNDLSEERLEKVIELEAEMKDLAPPRPPLFDIDNLGLEL